MNDVLVAAGGVVVVVGACYSIARVARSFWAGFKAAVREATEDLHGDVRDMKHVVDYHLGPNGTTTPIWQRLRDVEGDLKTHMRDVADNQGENP